MEIISIFGLLIGAEVTTLAIQKLTVKSCFVTEEIPSTIFSTNNQFTAFPSIPSTTMSSPVLVTMAEFSFMISETHQDRQVISLQRCYFEYLLKL